MRSHAKTQSTPAGGRLRLALLLGVAAAFLLVPVAQASAAGAMKVNITGFVQGGGEVTSIDEEFPPGEPPIECVLPEGLEEGAEPEGVCENQMFEIEPGVWVQKLNETPGPHSKLLEWKVASGQAVFGCSSVDTFCLVKAEGEENAEVNVSYFCEDEEGPACTPEPPIFDVTASKAGTGNGWLHSEAPGYLINCGGPCTSKTATFEGEAVITAAGAQFAAWDKCDGTPSGRTCTLTEEGEAVAKYTANHALTVDKTGTGNGWVHSEAPGYVINCGGPCTSKTGFFEPGTEVTLTASGGEFTEWVSCPGVVSERDCTVTMTEDLAAEVKYGS